MTLQDMMDEVSQMDALAEDGVVPLAVQLAQSDEEDERFSNITCHGENRLGSNPFVDQGEGLEQEMSH